MEEGVFGGVTDNGQSLWQAFGCIQGSTAPPIYIQTANDARLAHVLDPVSIMLMASFVCELSIEMAAWLKVGEIVRVIQIEIFWKRFRVFERLSEGVVKAAV
jgi:hypothetical protein